jgi:hypothetical protein
MQQDAALQQRKSRLFIAVNPKIQRFCLAFGDGNRSSNEARPATTEKTVKLRWKGISHQARPGSILIQHRQK